MFFTVKKRVVFISVICALIVVGIIVALSAPTATTLGRGKTVVIDAGHGGEDGGVVGRTTGIKESDINLAISKKVKDFLEAGGYKVVMTRSNDSGLYGAVSSNKKLADMKKRKEIILDSKPDLVVSIHQNFYPSTYVSGAQVFYAPNGNGGDEATVMQKILNRELNCNRTEAKGDYYIVQCAPYPSILIECGFLSNPTEESKLVTAQYQEKVAYTIYTGINFILGSPVIS